MIAVLQTFWELMRVLVTLFEIMLDQIGDDNGYSSDLLVWLTEAYS